MGRAFVAGVVLACAAGLGAPTQRAAALPIAPPPASIDAPWNGVVHMVHYRCRCGWGWDHREYWRWDHRPIWDDPWRVLKPNFFGSPEPHLVPAEIWAHEWHLPRRYWLRHHRYRLHRR
ncbi:MAG: hypothetical protein WBF58_03600 [Xanthobacteraceae bacterium]